MSDLLALAARCEAATGRDRELDLTIFATLRPDEFKDAAEAKQYASADYQRIMNRADWYYISTIGLPRYTASLDAAMTLVPWEWAKEHEYRFGLEQDDWRDDRWCARFDQMCDGGDTILAVAATPALALCAAALKARAVQ